MKQTAFCMHVRGQIQVVITNCVVILLMHVIILLIQAVNFSIGAVRFGSLCFPIWSERGAF